MEGKKDRRIIRTKKLIVDALISILKEKSVENITVSELAKKADITRATFYQYYKSPVEMLETLQNEITYDVEEIVLETEEYEIKIVRKNISQIKTVYNW